MRPIQNQGFYLKVTEEALYSSIYLIFLVSGGIIYQSMVFILAIKFRGKLYEE